MSEQTLQEQIASFIRHKADCDLVTWPDGIPIGGPEPCGDGTYYTEPTDCTCGLQQAADRLASLEQQEKTHADSDTRVAIQSEDVAAGGEVGKSPRGAGNQSDAGGTWSRTDQVVAGRPCRCGPDLCAFNGHRWQPDGACKVRADLEAQVASLEQAQQALRDEKNEAYRQRNVLVAALARLFPSGIRATSIEGWSDDWHGCVYVDLPDGQVSYHYHDSQAHLFAGLPPYKREWDGHDKATVEARLAQLNAGHNQ